MRNVTASSPSASLDIHALGPLTITLEGRGVAELHRAPQLQTLLGYLIVHRGEWLDRSRLAGTLWPDVLEDQARRSLSSNLWRLRQLAEGQLVAALDSERHVLRWCLPAGAWLDVAEWESHLSALRVDPDPDGPQFVESLRRAVEVASLYRGPLLEGVESPWCEPLRQRYATQYATLLRTLTTGYAALEKWDEAQPWGDRWVVAEPYDEGAHEALIRLHQGRGQPIAAKNAWQNYVAAWQELGLTPNASLYETVRLPTVVGVGESKSQTLILALTSWLPTLPFDHPNPLLQRHATAICQALSEAVVRGASELAARYEESFDWKAARHSYEVALSLVEGASSTLEVRKKQFALRLDLDRLYDRLSQREAQRANLNQALALAESLGDLEGQSEVWARLCWLAQRTCQVADSLHAASKALSLGQGSLMLRAQALRLLGISHDLLGNYELAVRTHAQALAHDDEEAGSQRLSHVNLANTLLAVNLPWKALHHATLALPHPSSHPPTLVDILAQGNHAMALTHVGVFHEAEREYYNARALAVLLGSQSHEAWILCRAAMLSRWMGLSHDALVWAQESWSLSQTVEDRRTAIEAALELALGAGLRGEHAQGVSWCRHAQQLVEESGLRRYAGKLFLLRSHLAAQAADWADAQALAEQARLAIVESGEARLRLPLLALFAHVAAATGRSAARWYRQAHGELRVTLAQAPNEAECGRFAQATELRRWAASATVPRGAPPLSWVW